MHWVEELAYSYINLPAARNNKGPGEYAYVQINLIYLVEMAA